MSPNSLLEIPVDAGLPGLEVLFDVERMLDACHRCGLGPFADGRACYVRYKPATNCIVLYELTGAHGPEWVYAKHYAADRVPRSSDRHRLTAYLADDRIALAAFPSDLQIPALGMAAVPEPWSQVVSRTVSARRQPDFADSWSSWRHVRYKPERRCVLKGVYRPNGEPKKFFARFYAAETGASAARWHRRLVDAGEVSTPRCLGYSRRHGVLLLRKSGGSPLHRLLTRGPKVWGEAIDRTSQALAAWHRLPFPADTTAAARPEAVALSTVRDLERLLGDTGWLERAEALAAHAPSRSDESVLLHGDFYDDQVLLREDGSARLIDLDHVAVGDPLIDVATFCAHLRLDAIAGRLDPAEAAAMEERFVAGYASASRRPGVVQDVNWFGAQVLLRLAPRPFRRLMADWRFQVRRLLEAGLTWEDAR